MYNHHHIYKVYEEIKSDKNLRGNYKKILNHIHTPESHDFNLHSELDSVTFQRMSEQEVLKKYIKKEFASELYMHFEQIDNDLPKIYKDKKDFYAYLLLANQIIKSDYQMIVVTDHHKISGIEKLQSTLNQLDPVNYRNVVSGVEISCADRLHVVVIFQDEKNKKCNSG